MKDVSLLMAGIFLSVLSMAQGPYPPAADQEGSDAMAADSSVFIHWADEVNVERGWMSMEDTTLGLASVGEAEFAVGEAGQSGVVSLGDGGIAIMTFEGMIYNGDGPDFAIFENSFSDSYLELAHVEVSSNGVDYIRFPSVSLTQGDSQVGAFGLLDPTKLNNLAGKYRALYGTPFDLDELEATADVDLNAITHVRIIDVVGSIDDDQGSIDSEGYFINDPFPTPFPSSGFDLDALGIIHWSPATGIDETKRFMAAPFPNPCKDKLYFSNTNVSRVEVLQSDGRRLLLLDGNRNFLNTGDWPVGNYILIINNHEHYQITKS